MSLKSHQLELGFSLYLYNQLTKWGTDKKTKLFIKLEKTFADIFTQLF